MRDQTACHDMMHCVFFSTHFMVPPNDQFDLTESNYFNVHKYSSYDDPWKIY